jgi:hypothetical protein
MNNKIIQSAIANINLIIAPSGADVCLDQSSVSTKHNLRLEGRGHLVDSNGYHARLTALECNELAKAFKAIAVELNEENRPIK